MGEAKRKGAVFSQGDLGDRKAQRILERGVGISLIGTNALIQAIISADEDFYTNPRLAPLRTAVSYFDRVRSREIQDWECCFCRVKGAGLKNYGMTIVLSPIVPPPKPTSFVVMLCDACTGIPSDEIMDRVMRVTGTHPMQVGMA